MILEGAMIALATSIMTIFHPGWAFGEKWADAGWSWKKNRRVDAEAAQQFSEVPSSLLK